jgi:hypothetical protein
MRAFVAAVLALAGVLATARRLSAQDTHGSLRHVHGVVESGVTGRALRDAEVVVTWTSRLAERTVEKSARQRTDGNGRFDLRDLPAQVVTLRVRALGFVPWLRELDLRVSDRLVTVHLETATTVLQEVAVRADTAADRLARVAAVSTLDAQALAAMRGRRGPHGGVTAST